MKAKCEIASADYAFCGAKNAHRDNSPLHCTLPLICIKVGGLYIMHNANA